MSLNASNVPSISYQQSNGNGTTINKGSAGYVQADPFKTLLSPNKGYSFPSSQQIILAARNVSFAPNVLGTTTHQYTSPNYNDIINLAAYFGDWGCSYQITEGPVHNITISAPWDTVTNEDWWISLYASEQWEIAQQVGTKNILYSGLLNNSFALPGNANNTVVLPVGLQAAVQVANKNGNATLNLTGSNMTSDEKAQYAAYLPKAYQTLMYMKAGIEGVPSYTQVLKRTAVIDIRNKDGAFQTEIDETNAEINALGSVNFVYSTQDLIRNYPIPKDTVAKFLLPSYSKVLGVINVDPFYYRVYAGWLVKPPSLQFIGRNKIQLTQEFVWDEWAAGLYHIHSSTGDFGCVYAASGSSCGTVPFN